MKVWEKNEQKVKFFPAHPIKACRGIRRTALIIVNSVLDGGEWLNSRSGRFTTGNNCDN